MVVGSIPVVGSSRSTIGGLPMRAMAVHSLRLFPPLLKTEHDYFESQKIYIGMIRADPGYGRRGHTSDSVAAILKNHDYSGWQLCIKSELSLPLCITYSH